MHISKNTTDTHVTFTVNFEPKDFEPARLKALAKLASKVKIPGFREGRAPANLVENQVDPNELAYRTLDIMITKAFPEIDRQSQAYDFIDEPKLEIKKFIPGEMAEITFTRTLFPPVKLGKYRDLKLKFKPSKVDDALIDDVVKRIAEGLAKTTAVIRAAKKGDEVVIDFVGKKDGKAFPGGSSKDFRLRLGSGQLIPGFEDGIIKHKAGDKFNLDLTFPKDYQFKDLAGQKTVFEVTLKQVLEVVLPPLDDTFPAKLGLKDKTFKAFRAEIATKTKQDYQEHDQKRYQNALLDAVVASSKLTPPDFLIERQLKVEREQLEDSLKKDGLTIDTYCQNDTKQKARLEAELSATAKQKVIDTLVINALAKALKIQISEPEIDTRIKLMFNANPALANQPTPEALSDPNFRARIANYIRIDKTLDALMQANPTE